MADAPDPCLTEIPSWTAQSVDYPYRARKPVIPAPDMEFIVTDTTNEMEK